MGEWPNGAGSRDHIDSGAADGRQHGRDDFQIQHIEIIDEYFKWGSLQPEPRERSAKIKLEKVARASVLIIVWARGGGIWHPVDSSTKKHGVAIGAGHFQPYLNFPGCPMRKAGKLTIGYITPSLLVKLFIGLIRFG